MRTRKNRATMKNRMETRTRMRRTSMRPLQSMCAKVAVWFQNAIMKYLWGNATPGQKGAVEQHKKKEAGEETEEELEEEEIDSEGALRKQVKRLQDIVMFVTVDLVWQFSDSLFRHVAAAQVWNNT
jgi:hypothetical protein